VEPPALRFAALFSLRACACCAKIPFCRTRGGGTSRGSPWPVGVFTGATPSLRMRSTLASGDLSNPCCSCGYWANGTACVAICREVRPFGFVSAFLAARPIPHLLSCEAMHGARFFGAPPRTKMKHRWRGPPREVCHRKTCLLCCPERPLYGKML